MTATQAIKAGKRWISHLILLGIILKGPLRINASRIPRGVPELGSNMTASSTFHDDGQHGSHEHRHQPALSPTVSSEQQTKKILEILNDDSLDGTVDPLCAADANPFADCLPSNTKTLKNFSKGTKQHISICLKFHQGLQCVTQYADRCFPPGTSDFLIPLNRSYARSCSHLRIGEDIIGDRCYVELKPRWDECVRILRYHVQKGDPVSAAKGANPDGQSSGDGARSGVDVNDDAASDDAVLVPEALDQSGVPFGFGGNRNRCCDRYRALKCVYEAARSTGACSASALLRTVRATDLMSRDYLADDCLKADPSNCYFPSSASSSAGASLASWSGIESLVSWQSRAVMNAHRGREQHAAETSSHLFRQYFSTMMYFFWLLAPTLFSTALHNFCLPTSTYGVKKKKPGRRAEDLRLMSNEAAVPMTRCQFSPQGTQKVATWNPACWNG